MAKMTIDEIANTVDTKALINRPLSDWRPLLAQECQVYVFGEEYIAKRFDQIHYKFCKVAEAKEILVDNLYAILRYKYFPKSSEEVDQRINDIVRNVTTNLKSTLKKVSFDKDSDAEPMRMLPDYCLAFRNGVYDFWHNRWLFKYDITRVDTIKNSIYQYDPSYAVLWYFNFNFEPLPIDIKDLSLYEFVEFMKELTANPATRNYTFELIYNMSHNNVDVFDKDKLMHLCQVIGYYVLQSFSQHFVMFVGAGGNGKNSLIDSNCTHFIVPMPASNDLDAIENDRFISGALENKYQNAFLESTEKTYETSKNLKNLTGSMYQTIESKGVNKHSGIMNCKFIFSANDQDKLKFSDTTPGFRRRINLIEVFYSWDADKRFMKRGDYYDTSFSEDLREIKNDKTNVIAFCYFAMYGIMNATKNFSQQFKFTLNDWKMTYSDADFDLKSVIDNVTPSTIIRYTKRSQQCYEDCKTLFFDMDKQRLYKSDTMKVIAVYGYDDMLKLLDDDEQITSYFAENDAYISLRLLQQIVGDMRSPTAFTQALKKVYGIKETVSLFNNKPYVKCRFVGRRLKIII